MIHLLHPMYLKLHHFEILQMLMSNFYGKAEDEALFNALRENIDPNKVELIEMDCNINDPEFGETAAKKLIEIM